MVYYTDRELEAATEAVLNNVLKPMALMGIKDWVAKETLHGYVQREVANALVAAAKERNNESN